MAPFAPFVLTLGSLPYTSGLPVLIFVFIFSCYSVFIFSPPSNTTYSASGHLPIRDLIVSASSQETRKKRHTGSHQLNLRAALWNTFYRVCRYRWLLQLPHTTGTQSLNTSEDHVRHLLKIHLGFIFAFLFLFPSVSTLYHMNLGLSIGFCNIFIKIFWFYYCLVHSV